MTRFLPCLFLLPLLGGCAGNYAGLDRASASGAYCARQGGNSGYENCGYPSLAACQAAVSGVGGGCSVNPRFVRYDERQRPRKKRRAVYR